MTAQPGPPGQEPPNPLPGYEVVEINVANESPISGHKLGTVTWPPGCIPVAVLHHRKLQAPEPGLCLRPGDRISLLAPRPEHAAPRRTHNKHNGHPPGAAR